MNRLLFALPLLVLAACGDPSPDPFPAQMQTHLALALQDEWKAEAFYAHLAKEYPDQPAFRRSAEGEATHSAQLARLYRERGLPVPTPPPPDSLPSYPSLPDACRATARLEQANLALYGVLLEVWAADLPDDFATVLRSFRRETEQQHLPRVVACSGADPAPDATALPAAYDR